jgi:hypothetical protein
VARRSPDVVAATGALYAATGLALMLVIVLHWRADGICTLRPMRGEDLEAKWVWSFALKAVEFPGLPQ